MKTSGKFFIQHLPQLPFASCNAVSLAQIRVCPKAVLTTLDFNRGVLPSLFLHLTSGSWGMEQGKVSLGDLLHVKLSWIISFQVNSGSCARFSVTIPWHLEMEQSWGSEWVPLQLWKCCEVECTRWIVGTSWELPVGCHPLCPGKVRWTRGMRSTGTCREGCSMVGQHL